VDATRVTRKLLAVNAWVRISASLSFTMTMIIFMVNFSSKRLLKPPSPAAIFCAEDGAKSGY
jgi:hypothetical protein